MHKSLDVENLSASYGETQVLENISFSMKAGRLVGIIGPNGSGKSTLLKGILGLIPLDTGEVKFCHEPLSKVRKRVAYKPQSSEIDWDFPITVIDTVLLGTYPKLGLFKRPGKRERDLAMKCLGKVGMADFAQRQISEMSGGQRQRVFLARALAQEAECFFLDEPFVGIDASSEEIIINNLKELRDLGKTIYLVHHDLTKVTSYFDDIILINKKLYGAGPVEDIFKKEIMEEAFGSSLSVFYNWEVKS
ncbi:MAG: metal ABC transporter ATP-binding protein [Firmicutes bacterium]|nr:metal ABC transporter ATP-binding protein [Bacillota bacterium]